MILLKFGEELWILQVCRLLNRTWSCVKETLWIQLKQFYLTVHWFLFTSHDLPVAKRFSSWLWRLLSTMLLLTVRILTCTYKGQAAPTVIGSENTDSSKALWEEFNLQITKQNAQQSQDFRQTTWKLTLFLCKHKCGLQCCPSKRKKKNQTTKWTKDPRDIHLAGILFHFLKDW